VWIRSATSEFTGQKFTILLMPVGKFFSAFDPSVVIKEPWAAVGKESFFILKEFSHFIMEKQKDHLYVSVTQTLKVSWS